MTPTHLLFRCLCLCKPTVDTLLSSLYRTPKSRHRATCPNRQTAPKASISSSSLNHISTSSIDIRTGEYFKKNFSSKGYVVIRSETRPTRGNIGLKRKFGGGGRGTRGKSFFLKVALRVPTPPEKFKKLGVGFFHTLGTPTSHGEGHISERITTYPLFSSPTSTPRIRHVI